MKYYSVTLLTIDVEKGKRYQLQHLNYLEKMVQEEKIFSWGKYIDDEGELIIYLAESIEQVKLFVSRDPFVEYQASDYEIHEWDMKICTNVVVNKLNELKEKMYE